MRERRILTWDQVRSRRTDGIVILRIGSLRNAEGRSGLDVDDTAQGPSAEHRLRHAPETGREWNLPNIAGNEAMANIENAARFLVYAAVSRILAPAPFPVGLVLLVVDHMRPVISGREAQAASEAVFEACLQRMIGAVAVGGQQADAVELWIRAASLNVARTGIGAVEVELTGVQKRAFVADVTRLPKRCWRPTAAKPGSSSSECKG